MINTAIDNIVKLELGSPILDLVDGEQDTLNLSKTVALFDYFRMCPLVREQFASPNGHTSLNIPINDLYTKFNFTPPVDGQNITIYYIGVGGIDTASAVDDALSIFDFNSSLLGPAIGGVIKQDPWMISSRKSSLRFQSSSYMKQMLYQAQTAMSSGANYFNYDKVTNNVEILLGVSTSQVRIVHFFGSTDIEHVKNNHIEIFSLLVLNRFLQAVIASRGSIGLDSDHTVDIGILQSRLDKIQTKLDEITPLYAYKPISWN